ncbi:hypothetical protein LIER_41916 [Lithospermum erythrorhizon]|uniref:Uncharacterized protein n=1 Tax=Lithospermum erythrorhizon TaxID=34254 RepID=A0AAV3RI62_LITER
MLKYNGILFVFLKLKEDWDSRIWLPKNTVYLCKLLWNIASMKDTLWVKWVHTIRVKGKSTWHYEKRPTDPWYWKKLIKVRSLIQHEYSVSVQNRESISFLFDCWAPFGLVWEYLSS